MSSTSLQHAGLIRTRLRTAPAVGELATPTDITEVEVVIYKQQAIQSKIDAVMAKATGTAILILSQGFQVIDKNAGRPRLAWTYNITVWSKSVIADGELLADAVMESIILRLWQWIPADGHAHGECEIRNGGLVPDGKWLKIDCEVVIPISL